MQHRVMNDLANADLPTRGKAFEIPGQGYLIGWTTAAAIPSADSSGVFAPGAIYFVLGAGANSLNVNRGTLATASWQTVTSSP